MEKKCGVRQDRERDAIKTAREKEKEIENAEERRKMVPQRGTGRVYVCVQVSVCL